MSGKSGTGHIETGMIPETLGCQTGMPTVLTGGPREQAVVTIQVSLLSRRLM